MFDKEEIPLIYLSNPLKINSSTDFTSKSVFPSDFLSVFTYIDFLGVPGNELRPWFSQDNDITPYWEKKGSHLKGTTFLRSFFIKREFLILKRIIIIGILNFNHKSDHKNCIDYN